MTSSGGSNLIQVTSTTSGSVDYARRAVAKTHAISGVRAVDDPPEKRPEHTVCGKPIPAHWSITRGTKTQVDCKVCRRIMYPHFPQLGVRHSR